MVEVADNTCTTRCGLNITRTVVDVSLSVLVCHVDWISADTK